MRTKVEDTYALSALSQAAAHICASLKPDLAPSRSVPVWSFVLPILKCAACPACLNVFGGVFAGARLGFLADQQLHEGVVGVALLADVLILGAAFRHHRFPWPLAVCGLGALLIVAGHLTHATTVEVWGFVVLTVAAFWNWRVLRTHHKLASHCTHCNHGDTAVMATPPLWRHRRYGDTAVMATPPLWRHRSRRQHPPSIINKTADTYAAPLGGIN